MKFHCFTLGCKVNQYETQAMERLLTALGHTPAPEAECDVLIVNTCTVTSVADRKDRTLIHRLRRAYPRAVLGVCGCYAQMHAEEARQMGADVVFGSAGREEFLQRLLQRCRERDGGQEVRVDDALRRRAFERLPAGGLLERTRAMLKVQDGCANFCTYCIIPYARGPVRSLPAAEAAAQTAALWREGYREVTVTGIEIASWGRDLGGAELPELIAAVCEAAPELRIRLGSLEPRIVGEAFCRLRRYPNLCPQFHLSLQSGSDSVLRRMRRSYDTARYLESVRLLRQAFPGCALTTDLIVGFPGETEEEFAETLAFLERCEFAAVHVFPYSRRPGTPAADLPDQVPKAVKSARAARAAAEAERLSRRFRESLLGSLQEVLFEQPEDGVFSGHAKNGVKVFAAGGAKNRLQIVRVTALHGEGVDGIIL